MKTIYLDTAAATPLNPMVKRAMAQVEQKTWSNPASLHVGGVAAAAALVEARQTVAKCLSAHTDEIVFTSGGTESNNLAVLGAPALLSDGQAGEVIVSAIEHASVLAPAARRGAIILPVDNLGQIKLTALKSLLNKNTSLVSIIYAHNEIGTIQNIKELGKIIRRHRIQFKTSLPYLHLDACQAPRFLNLNTRQLGVDLMTINASKIYGPKGVGALFIKRGTKLTSRTYGGGQEAGWRAGTENVPGIVGLATALNLAVNNQLKESKKLITLRDYAAKKILTEIPEAVLNGDPINRLPNNLNFSFAGVLGEQVVIELSAVGIAASTGSACSIPKHDDAYVILALGKSTAGARGTVRFTFDRETTKKDLDAVIKQLKIIITNLRITSHAYATNLAL